MSLGRRRPRRIGLFLLGILLFSGCGPGTLVIGAVVIASASSGGGDSGGGGGGRPAPRPLLESARFVDLDGNGSMDSRDWIVISFTAPVAVQGNPLANDVLVLDPPGQFGPLVEVTPGVADREVFIGDPSGAAIQPNGVHGVDPLSTGINLNPGQRGITSGAGAPVPSAADPVDLAGELNPRVVQATFADLDGNCIANQGDVIDVLFSSPVTVTTPDPDQAFWLLVSNDTFGTGAQFAGGMPASVLTVTIQLGTSPLFNDRGAFDRGLLLPGSPSGLDLGVPPGGVVDATYPAVMALPSNPPGFDMSGPGPVCAPRLVSAVFSDDDDDGLLGPGDRVTVTFDGDVNLQGSPLAADVLEALPPGSFGAGAIPEAGAVPQEIVVRLQAGASLQPNGTFGIDLVSSGINLLPGQTGIVEPAGTPLLPMPTPLDLGGELNPKISAASFSDANGSCTIDSGDILDVTFSSNVTFTTSDPNQAFQLPVAGDTFGAGAQIQGGTPVDVGSAVILLGTGPVLQVAGSFGPTVTGSPSGLDVGFTVGVILDALFAAVPATPSSPPGVDVGFLPGACSPQPVSVVFQDVDANGLADAADTVTVALNQAVSLPGVSPVASVFVLDPPGSLGVGATVAAGPGSAEVTISPGAGATFEPNGTYGIDPGSSGLNVLPGQTLLQSVTGPPVQPAAAPLEIQGELNPRITLVTFIDQNGTCFVDSGDWIEVTFSAAVTFATPDPALAFQLPVAGDFLGTGSQFQGGGTPGDVSTVTVVVGAAPVIAAPGTFDPGMLLGGSPSGLDITGAPGMVVHAIYTAVPALPLPQAGVDIGAVTGTAGWESLGDGQPGARYGTSVAPAGDVNGDGFGDFIVGARTYDAVPTDVGKAYVHHGRACWPDATPSWTSTGDDVGGDFFGGSVASAGDVNNDGYDDVIVGASGADVGLINEGKAFLYMGGPAGLSATPDWTSSGEIRDRALFGWDVASAGDVNNDGFDDVIVGAMEYTTTQSLAGKAYLFLGGAGGLAPTWTWESSGDDQSIARFANAVSSAGDVNNDGFDDVIIGARFFNTIESNAGKAYVYLGNSSGLDTAPLWTSVGEDQSGAQYGTSVACAGDVNTDGFSDIIVGAHWFDTPQPNAGKAYVYYGGPSGPSATPDWTATGDNLASSSFGWAVAPAGDVDNDGFDDVIIGAYAFNLGGESGKVYVYTGGASGLSPTVFWVSTGDSQANAWFGRAVAGAGDMNSDSFDDVLVGAPRFDPGGGGFVGKAYILSVVP